MARMPGATWQPKAVSGRSARRKGRCVVYHVAVSEAQSLMPGSSADWHFYVARDGRIYQYIDTDYQSWATGAANASAISVETQGGVIDAQGEPWSAAQVESLAAIARWAHDTEGIPLRLMASSLPTEKGLGWHRLGCDPWRVPGGELWSSAYGKVCPGDAKIAQMPDVLRVALNGATEEDDMFSDTDRWALTNTMNAVAATRLMVWKLANEAGAPVDVDEVALAKELAPLLVSASRSLSDADLQAVATAVADEQARRQSA